MPPNRSTIDAISAFMRASSSAIRFHVSEAIASILLRHVARRPERGASIAKQAGLLHRGGFPARRPSRADFEQHKKRLNASPKSPAICAVPPAFG